MAELDGEAKQAGHGRQGLKLALELGPLVLALVAYLLAGFYWATGVLMASTVVAVVATRVVFGRVGPALAATTVVVLVFGAMTLWLRDPSFIKMKPTIVNIAFAAALFFGLATDRPFLKLLLGEALRLSDEGWRVLTWRWACFFVVLAAANEVVWRNFSDGTWWTFKVAIFPLTMLFFAAQWGVIKRHMVVAADATDKAAKS
ncbi:MAG: inner membrane-spanning protein YciB [Hyphomicrobiaceae bacterium]|nr:inner membrane-spanning protein YciB [Hyphomicrobiaceae bacterium]